jgi:hypothetical protein
MLKERDLGLRPMQAELFRLNGQGSFVNRRFDRGIASLIVLNQLGARILLRFSTRTPAVSAATVSGDYDAVVLPGSVGVYAVERYKWVSALVDYAGAASAQDNQLQAIGLESIVAYQPAQPGPAYGITPAGLFVPLLVDAAGRLVSNPASLGTDVGASATAAAGALAPAIAGVAGLTNFLTGFEVTGGGATGAAALDVTITGLLDGTLHYAVEVPVGAGLAIAPVVVEFVRPRPASAVNTAITLNVPSFGAGNLIESAAIHGYRL